MVSVSADGCTAAVSEDGALYTWGDGAAGNLGYCNALRQFIPRRVEGALPDHIITQVLTFSCVMRFLAKPPVCRQRVKLKAASRSCYPMYSNDENSGEGRRCLCPQVSCGPYHTAAVSAPGALFTWGDGLCGKLGHGTLDSCSEPRQVDHPS